MPIGRTHETQSEAQRSPLLTLVVLPLAGACRERCLPGRASFLRRRSMRTSSHRARVRRPSLRLLARASVYCFVLSLRLLPPLKPHSSETFKLAFPVQRFSSMRNGWGWTFPERRRVLQRLLPSAAPSGVPMGRTIEPHHTSRNLPDELRHPSPPLLCSRNFSGWPERASRLLFPTRGSPGQFKATRDSSFPPSLPVS